jgi:nucleotide-binding universal stress UspA family protein
VSIVRGEGDCESVGQLICARADDLRAALIAMAAHNKGALVRFLVGSTTQYCLRHARATVLVMQHG